MSKLKTTQTTNYQFDKITCEQNPNMAFKDYVIVDNNDNWTKADEAIKSVEDGMTTNKADLVNVKNDIVEIKERIKEGIKGDRGQSAYEVAVEEGFSGTVDEWLESLKGEQGRSGQDGREIELRKHETYIQYKYAGEPDTAWRNVVALEYITGPQGASGANGKQIELQKSDTHIQWRYQGAESWNNLIELSAIKGVQGERGADGREIELRKAETHVQYKYVGEGEEAWQNVVALQDIKGATGERGLQGVAGVNGKNIELQKSSTHIQWRVAGEGSWNDLVALSDLKGEPGESGGGSAGQICVLRVNGVSPASNGEVYLYPEDLNAVDTYTFETKALGETLTLTPEHGYSFSEQKNYKKEKEVYINFKLFDKGSNLPSGGNHFITTLPFTPRGANSLLCHCYDSGDEHIGSRQINVTKDSYVNVNIYSNTNYAYISGIILI